MQCLEVSGAVRRLYGSFGVKGLIEEVDGLAFALQKYKGNQSGGLNSSLGLKGHKVHRRGVLQTDGTAGYQKSRAFRERPTVKRLS
jgi:hypothetical protein